MAIFIQRAEKMLGMMVPVLPDGHRWDTMTA